MSGSNFAVRHISFEDAEAQHTAESDIENSDLHVEIEEISELRRLVAEITELDPTSYTTT
jgi:hypothetical protein